MGFNPLNEKGTPIEKQFLSWSEVNVKPYDKRQVHPYTRTRVILMNGIEVESALFLHQFARHASDPDLKRKLALSRRIEQQQQKLANWLIPGDESNLEVTIGFEQVAVDLTAWLARNEPDPMVKAALDYALLEDFDHLYRYANLMEMTMDVKARDVVGDLTEIFPGRPTALEHQHPFDTIRAPYDRKTADFLTKLHVLTIVAAEQQTMNLYMNVGNRAESELARGLYLEIAQIEEQHVSHYESLADPEASWFEMLLLHEYNEAYLYYACAMDEPDQRIRKIWERNLEAEIGHLHAAVELFEKYENRDPAEILPSEFPELVHFQSNKDYVRDVLAAQVDLTAYDNEFMDREKLPKDSKYPEFQEKVNTGTVPSRQVISDCVSKTGKDYRCETEGEHPVERFRERKKPVL